MPENQGTSVEKLQGEPMFAHAVDFSLLDSTSWPDCIGGLARLAEFAGWLAEQPCKNALIVSHKLAIEGLLQELSVEARGFFSVENCVPICATVTRSKLRAFAARMAPSLSSSRQRSHFRAAASETRAIPALETPACPGSLTIRTKSWSSLSAVPAVE